MKCLNCSFVIEKEGHFTQGDSIKELIVCSNSSCGFEFDVTYPDYPTYVECRDREKRMRRTGRVV